MQMPPGEFRSGMVRNCPARNPSASPPFEKTLHNVAEIPVLCDGCSRSPHRAGTGMRALLRPVPLISAGAEESGRPVEALEDAEVGPDMLQFRERPAACEATWGTRCRPP